MADTCRIITISRQRGSAGHAIGKMAAERLGIPFYDKEIITMIAERSGLARETVEREGEYASTGFFNMSAVSFSPFSADDRSTMPLRDQINAWQSDLIRELAAKGPCVIVGRCADFVLRNEPNVLNVFITASEEDRRAWVVAEEGIAEKDAAGHILEMDRKRSRYYKYVTDTEWGIAANYDLCLNRSVFGLEGCVKLILKAAEL